MAVDPKCLEPSIEFGKPGSSTVVASICGFSLKLPNILPVTLLLPDILALLPKLPIPKFAFALTCDPNNPIDITAGLEFGGGRIPCSDPPSDPEETAQAA